MCDSAASESAVQCALQRTHMSAHAFLSIPLKVDASLQGWVRVEARRGRAQILQLQPVDAGGPLRTT